MRDRVLYGGILPWWLAAPLLGAFAASPTPATAQSATVTLTASSLSVRTGEAFRVRLTVQAEGAGIESVNEPDLGDFDIQSRSTSQPMQFSFGFGGRQTVVQQSRVHDYQLIAVRPGTFTVGPVEASVGGQTYRSQRIRIEVSGAAISRTQPVPPSPTGTDKPPPEGTTSPPGVNSELDGALFSGALVV